MRWLLVGICLAQMGLWSDHHHVAALRLEKVVVPAYELYGGGALLECPYELKTKNATAKAKPTMRQQQQLRQHQHYSNSGHLQLQQQQQQHRDRIGHHRQYPAGSTYSSDQQQQQQQPLHHQQQQQPDEYEPQPLKDQHYPQQHYAFDSKESGTAGGVGAVIASSSSSVTSAVGAAAADADEEREEEDNDDDEEPETLYSVKWYKDNEEFYRYVPTANPTKHSYKVEGVRVDNEASNNFRVKLKRLTLKSSGLYRCEVSAEAPNFSSDHGEGRMEVIFLPRDGPHITGEERQYQIGDVLQLNCTSGKSHPPPQVEWLINDQPVDPASLRHYQDVVHAHGLITTVLGMQLSLDARHFRDGAMRVKCVASVSPVLWQGGKESIVQRRPQSYENREAMLLVRSGSFRPKASGTLQAFFIVLAVITGLCSTAPWS